MYIKFENPAIPGSSAEAGHQDEIEILSWNHGFTQPTSPTRGTAGSGTVEQASHSNLAFSKYMDKSSTELLRASWSGRQFGKVILSAYRKDVFARDNQPVLYLQVTMEHVIISNVSISAGAGDLPVENVRLDYGIIQYHYKDQQQSDGQAPLPARHDLEQRTIT